MNGPEDPDLSVSRLCHVDSGLGHGTHFDKQDGPLGRLVEALLLVK